jgi:hypothetical protein
MTILMKMQLWMYFRLREKAFVLTTWLGLEIVVGDVRWPVSKALG